MVKIYENSTVDGSAHDAIRAKLRDNVQSGREATQDAPDPLLVAQVREMLKREFEQNEQADTIYSRPHYDDLMDASSANVCWRYILHQDGDVEAAFELIKSTLIWRKDNRIDTMTAKDMVKDYYLRSPIGFTGKSKSGNDVVYAIGKNFRKPDGSVKQIIRDYIAFLLYDWDRKHKHDLAQLELVFDVSDTGLRNIDLDFSLWLVSIRDYVPARIKSVYFVGVPFIMRPIIRLIISWLPARFKRITHCGTYDELVRAKMEDESVPEEIGGKSDNKWRLAPIEARWASELDTPDSAEIFNKICEAISFNTSKEYLDRMYKMQIEYEKSAK